MLKYIYPHCNRGFHNYTNYAYYFILYCILFTSDFSFILVSSCLSGCIDGKTENFCESPDLQEQSPVSSFYPKLCLPFLTCLPVTKLLSFLFYRTGDCLTQHSFLWDDRKSEGPMFHLSDL